MIDATVEVVAGRVPVVAGATLMQQRNESDSSGANGTLRWGGASYFALEGTAGYSRVDYSATGLQFLNSHQTTAGINLRWLPPGPLHLGIGYRETRLRQPQALQFATGTVQ